MPDLLRTCGGSQVGVTSITLMENYPEHRVEQLSVID